MVHEFEDKTGDVHTREMEREPNNTDSTDGDIDAASEQMLTTVENETQSVFKT